MSSQATGFTPADAAATWTQTLIEPLLSSARRAIAEDAMTRVCTHHPRWAVAFFGGFIADMVGTFPPEDPWRTLSGRVGSEVFGPRPPATTGAVTASGAPFGTWNDSADRLPLIYRLPGDDPQMVAVADPLPDVSAGVIAASCYGWRDAVKALTFVQLSSPPAGEAPPAKWLPRWSGANLYAVASQAARWVVHRRRSYAGHDDVWPLESAFRWAWRADRIAADAPWPEADVDTQIAEETQVWDVVPGFGPDDF
ncbi:hypothetical protein GCM10009810_12190 [Nostocoides vanveenii]|uniref:Uncharacterized protein n=1 Tax=Nostocoides vanveenii TaxID=330835 RepID=A0ABN2KFS5_9MICO